MKEYDVVIIGAGPAGLNCAKYLAETDKKVLILEKNKEIKPFEFREMINSTRKFTLPLLLYFDGKGITEREGDIRQLKS